MTSIKMSGGKVVIDGREFKGGNISINRGKVTVDGVAQDGELVGDVNIVVHGDVESIVNSHGSVSCESAESIKTTHGAITVNGDVAGDVQSTHGSISAECINGSVKTTFGSVDKRL